jgi:5'-nucleotidase/UDP-sugar diphosphatase
MSGIDLIVDGHTHTRLDSPIIIKIFSSNHKTLIVQGWQWGLVFGKVDLWIQNKEIINFRFEAIC